MLRFIDELMRVWSGQGEGVRKVNPAGCVGLTRIVNEL